MLFGSQTTEYEGLSQSEYIIDNNQDCFVDEGTSNDCFAPILDEGTSKPAQNMFEELKHEFYQLLDVLEIHKQEFPEVDKCSEIRQLMQDATSEMRVSLRENSRKRKATDGQVINIMTEARPRTVSRTKHSKNC